MNSIFSSAFEKYLKDAAGESKAEQILDALQLSPTISIRINPLKIDNVTGQLIVKELVCQDEEQNADENSWLQPVPWCKEGFYLTHRPVFTLDPSFHAGAYYVQEPSSMFIDFLEPILNEINGGEPINILDLCASPGGKSTHLCSIMPKNSLLICNEVIKSRTSSLAENMIKWGNHDVFVTNNDASHFSDLRGFFDFILVDAPCSGEGMFRKDPEAIAEWSQNAVDLCVARQQRILGDIWNSLSDGGFLAYSTCTFNKYENDGNVAWLKSEFGATTVDISKYRDISPLLASGVFITKEGGYQFFPGLVRGEGFFIALLQKPHSINQSRAGKNYSKQLERLYKLPVFEKGVQKGRDWIPSAEYALSVDYANEFPSVELNKEQALIFLSRGNLILNDAPIGYLRITYKGLGLGFVKNLGNRLNNLHPMNRRIRMDITKKCPKI